MTTGQRPGAGAQGTAGAQMAGEEYGAQVAGGQHMAVRAARIPMRDGIELATTLYLPAQPAGPVPALLEYLPYRKDDAMLARDYELYAYLAAHGYAGARVDIRGTGSSDGDLPEGEYTEQEQLDAEDVIAWLAAQPWCTGAVGMWGISWGGFNAIQVALRRPPALRAIIAVDASDDLFHDDVHYIDGLLHIDEYVVMIDHLNALPPTPGFPVRLPGLRPPVRQRAVADDLAGPAAGRAVLAARLAAAGLRPAHGPGVPDRRLVRRVPGLGAPHARRRPRPGEDHDRPVEPHLPA